MNVEAADDILAPLVLFVYNRPDNTKKVLDSLAANTEAKDSILYIYCDGAKANANKETIRNIEETRKIVKTEDRFRKIIIVEKSSNKGLSNSIITAVTEICNKYGSIIVLEDDIVTSPFFLSYMNDALQMYKDVDTVSSINGYWYPIKRQLPETFFLNTQSCWGWATWKRAWDLFEPDGNKLLQKLSIMKNSKQFDLDGSIKYTQMLKDQNSNKIDSWAIRWDAVNFINNKLSLYPGNSLVQNIGFDGSGTHSGNGNYYNVHLSDKPITVSKLELIESIEARRELVKFYKKVSKDVLFKRIYRLLGLTRILKFMSLNKRS